jgi:uncharacterized DUF497 family protein
VDRSDRRPSVVLFTWSTAKSANNLSKHGVSFEEGATVLFDPLELSDVDPMFPDRSISVGTSDRGRLLLIVYRETSAIIRMISAREATRRERKAYEEGD